MVDKKNKEFEQTQCEEHQISTENEGLGEIRISSDVVTIIASNAVNQVKGVASLSGGIGSNLSQVLGRKSPYKGLKVDVTDNREVNIDLHVIVEYGVRIPDVAWKLQEAIKQTVETMTGLHVNEVNIHVQGVSFEKESKKEEAVDEEIVELEEELTSLENEKDEE
ncbi:MAG TPA: Asp23/Gls24 family envelope stress response protein [Thermoclostridium sp.]|nr:Asp23/Gls24 family envelope stress response protein [Thermoclostridium sp.]